MSAAQTVRLADYQPFPFVIDAVDLTFRLDPRRTRVLADIRFRRNPEAAPADRLELNGERMRLISCRVDGAEVTPDISDTGLSLAVPATPFTLSTEVEIDPQANTALEGLYMSQGMYCTQCEAEGFRKITYYPDRPDVMAPFRVRVEGEQPVLLSNGNPVAQGEGFAEWHDPWPKPAYLFALVAGALVSRATRFTTVSGREVALGIWVRPGDEGKCDYALDALVRSMRWDERVYGREYDLDVFNIVAVDDFNMGAMENKGLNIFNSKYVLASPETATDRDFERIEGIIAHEYFHNWTGNRVTCRDWFQLCLKEGLTVFRDQQFTSDMRSAAVKRIDDVLALRGRQFREDNGPLAHPVRPESYIEINNFYTATVYEKGAEVIGMLRRLVGDDGYARALDLYFERHDGDAATIEDWLKVFEDATGRDLGQFARWYSQSGTPRLAVTEDLDQDRLTLTFRQTTPPTPGQPDKAPQVIPIAVGVLDGDGAEIVPTRVLEMTGAAQSFALDLPAGSTSGNRAPVLSLLRDFSAPVILERQVSAEERAFLLAHDTDPFNRWEAGRALAKDVLSGMITAGAAPGPAYLDALRRVIADDSLDPAFRALALALPPEDDMAQSLFDAGHTPDPDVIFTAREQLGRQVARHLAAETATVYDQMQRSGPYSPDARDAGCRALRLACLGLMSRLDGGAAAARQFAAADNMTEQLGALGCLLKAGGGQEETARFYRQWQGDRLVIDKWFALQVGHAAPDQTAKLVGTLAAHPDFDWKNPNRFRSLFGALSANHGGFHHRAGPAYDLVADWLIRLDPLNPQTAARMTTMFEAWRRYDSAHQQAMRAALGRIGAAPGLSRDMGEMVERILG